MAGRHDAARKDARVLLEVKKELDSATKIQPCAACRHDMEQLGMFLEAKVASMGAGSPMEGETARLLNDLSYVNELSNIGIALAKISKPLGALGLLRIKPPYKRFLDKNRSANKAIREHLMIARLLLQKLKKQDRQYAALSKLLGYFLRATEFKISADPQIFFAFDKMVRFSYRTRLLGLAGRAIVGAKGVASCCME